MGKKKVIKQTSEEAIKEAEVLQAAMKKAENSDVSVKRAPGQGRIYIIASYNNILMTATDSQGNVLGWSSSGHLQFKGPKKATPFAAAQVAESLLQKIKKSGIMDFSVFIRGVGSGRESALRTLIARGVNLFSIKDVTPIPHGGCRPVKVRRI
jgi:small subunit ribosomal protein S11